MILRYKPTGQEAAVPLEDRDASAYLLAFDNTNGNATGVAVSSVSAQAASVSAVVRDETGAQIASGLIPLAAHGHSAFTLAVDKFRRRRVFVEPLSLIHLLGRESAP